MTPTYEDKKVFAHCVTVRAFASFSFVITNYIMPMFTQLNYAYNYNLNYNWRSGIVA